MLFTNFNAFNDSSTIYLSYPHFSRYWLTDSSNTFQLKDSGIKTWGQSSNQIHFHDQGDATKYSCDRCRETINYLLEPPVFDDLDAPYPNKYKLFSNFRFASKKTATNLNTFYGPKPVDSNSSPNDFSSNGKIIDEEQEPEAPEKKLNANTSSTPAKGPKNLQESSPVWQKQTVVDENQQFPFYNVLFPTLDMVTAKVVPKVLYSNLIENLLRILH